MTERDIKRLWGRAAGRCSIPDCRKQLCPYPNPRAILGEMCHIVGESAGGPRGKAAMPKRERNTYPNLILLCSEHHIIIDADASTWTVQRLHETKRQHEQWVEGQLSQGLMKGDVVEAIRRIDRYMTRQQWLRGLLWADIGNARFLQSLQQSDDSIWFNRNASKEFRDQYLNMLDQQYGDAENPPFGFEWMEDLLVFPDGYNEAETCFHIPHVAKPDCPTLLRDFRPVEKEGKTYWHAGQVVQVPFLPTENGYIWSHDEVTGLPDDVRPEPCDDLWGAYYWVRPHGVRTVIIGIGVLDPLECANGMAIWYSVNEARPFIGVRHARVATPELKRQMDEAIRVSYRDRLSRYDDALLGADDNADDAKRSGSTTDACT